MRFMMTVSVWADLKSYLAFFLSSGRVRVETSQAHNACWIDESSVLLQEFDPPSRRFELNWYLSLLWIYHSFSNKPILLPTFFDNKVHRFTFILLSKQKLPIWIKVVLSWLWHYFAHRYSNDGASLSRSDPFYRDTSVNIATSGAREFNPEKRESFNSYDYSPKESGYGSSSVNLRFTASWISDNLNQHNHLLLPISFLSRASDANLRTQSAARFTSEYRDLYRSSALDLRSPQTDFARSTSYN